ncbi:MAG: acyltransferase [Proteobacteria bacterium]|nr:MAG: acyltransferase [Pseudomonadota bacterium]
MTPKDRFYEIDLLRFLAALAVVFYHYTFRGFAEGGYSPVEYPVLGEFFKYGSYGVQLFFIISGFVILMTATKRDAAHFVISRITRLYPAFWVCVTLTTLAIVWKGGELFHVGLIQYLVNLTMISGFVGVEMVDGVYWTLLVELKFYALIFVLLVIGQIKRIEWFLAFWLLLTAIAFVLPFPRIITFLFLTDWSAFFIAGALFYLIRQNGLNFFRGIMLWSSFMLAIFENMRQIGHLEQLYNSYFSPVVTSVLISVFFVIFLLIALGKTQVINSPRLISLGVLTYPLYLIHQNIGFMVFHELGGSVNRYVLLGALVAAMLFAAWLIHKAVELPLGRWMNQALNRLWDQYGASVGDNKKPVSQGG